MRRAFSIIEILIVMAIILLLATIVAVGTGGSRRSAQSTVCASQLRQAAQALELYLNDSEGRIPSTLYHDLTPVLTYAKDRRILTCPLDPYDKGANWQSTRATGVRTSYLAPLTIYPEFMRQLSLADSNFALLVCLVHGRRRSYQGPTDPVNGFDGQVLQVHRDTSLHRKEVADRCFKSKDGSFTKGRMYWDFFTDAPMPKSVQAILADAGSVEIPCP